MLPKPILTFIKSQTILTLITSVADEPWGCCCYYAYDSKSGQLIISSYNDSKHIEQSSKNPNIAGNIFISTKRVGIEKGIQFRGTISKGTKHHQVLFYRSYPALKDQGRDIFAIDISYAKYTDNSNNICVEI